MNTGRRLHDPYSEPLHQLGSKLVYTGTAKIKPGPYLGLALTGV